jgi:hypothetical protein
LRRSALNVLDHRGVAALHLAALRGLPKTAAAMVALGADASLRTCGAVGCSTPLALATDAATQRALAAGRLEEVQHLQLGAIAR